MLKQVDTATAALWSRMITASATALVPNDYRYISTLVTNNYPYSRTLESNDYRYSSPLPTNDYTIQQQHAALSQLLATAYDNKTRINTSTSRTKRRGYFPNGRIRVNSAVISNPSSTCMTKPEQYRGYCCFIRLFAIDIQTMS